MRKTAITEVQPGLILAKTILSGSGHILLKAGVEIKQQYLTYLGRLGIKYIYIRDSRIEGLEDVDLVKEETRIEARMVVAAAMAGNNSNCNSSKGLIIDDKAILQLVNKIIDDILDNQDILVQLADIRTKDDYLFAHSVNSCILATALGAVMLFDREALKCLATGAVLHDLGMIVFPSNTLNKPSALTESESRALKEHPQHGYNIFKKTPLYNKQAGEIILQHHERLLGQGYPQGLAGDKVSLLAQIVGIADVYDALTSDRPYRKAYLPHGAVGMLQQQSGKIYDERITKQFLSVVAAYPVGIRVVLSNGESGLVIANKSRLTWQPKVRVLYMGDNMVPHPAPYDLDLARAENVKVCKVL